MKLEVKHMYKEYEENEILKDINLEIQDGEFVAVMGQSGCGKSTLLYCVSGMDRPTKGEVLFGADNISELSEKEMEKVRLNRMGFIFQKANFLKNLSVKDNIMFPALQALAPMHALTLNNALILKHARILSPAVPSWKKEISTETQKLMKKMDILNIADHDIRKVSGGQLQRAAICRALINKPEILFGDEPTGALNSSATREVMDILNNVNREGTAILLVTHDAKVAARADRVIYLEDGCIKAEIVLGKYNRNTKDEREENLKNWLEIMGF